MSAGWNGRRRHRRHGACCAAEPTGAPFARLAMPWGLALLCALVGASPALAAPLDEARKSALTHLVRQDCGACHGMTLKGGLGRPLLPETLRERDADGIAAIILDGVPGTPMPPWRGLLTTEEAEWIARKLKEGFPR